MLQERLKQLREERNLSKIEIAKCLNISQSAYGKYELGKRKPDIDTLDRLAVFFNVSTDYLLGKTNIRNSIASDNLDISILSPEGKEKAKEYVSMLETVDKLKPEDQPEDIHKKA
jgi:transcriptional regulator with XRE-family HTH domain